MLPAIIAALFGAASLGCSTWTAWVGLKNDSPSMAAMTIALLVMATGFGAAAVQISTH